MLDIEERLASRYLILKALAHHSLGPSYLARDTYLPSSPLCIIKCLVSDGMDITLAERLFEREAQILSRLDRLGGRTPALHAWFDQGGSKFLVQEFVSGQSLSAWAMHEHRLSEGQAIALLRELLPVLDQLHAQDIIHLDICPHHLVRRYQDHKFVLIGFSRAKFSYLSNIKASKEIPILGRSDYLPPDHEDAVAPSLDLYALGITLLQLMMGIPPSQYQRHPISGDFQVLTDLRSQVSSPFFEILAQLVQIHSQYRYQKAQAVLTDLELISSKSQALTVVERIPSASFVLKTRLPKFVLVSLILTVTSVSIYLWVHLPLPMPQSLTTLVPSSAQSELLYTITFEEPVDQWSIGADGRSLFVYSDGNLNLFDLRTGSKRGQSIRSEALEVIRIDQDWAVGASADRVQVWHQGNTAYSLSPAGLVTDVMLDADQQRLAVAGEDGTIHVFNLSNGALLQRLYQSSHVPIRLMAEQPANRLVSVGQQQEIVVWDISAASAMPLVGHTRPVNEVFWVGSDQLLSCSPDQWLMWDLLTQTLLSSSKPNLEVAAMVRSKTDATLWLVNPDGRLYRWMLDLARLEFVLPTHPLPQSFDRIQMSADVDCQYVVVSTGRVVQVWRVWDSSSSITASRTGEFQ